MNFERSEKLIGLMGERDLGGLSFVAPAKGRMDQEAKILLAQLIIPFVFKNE